MDVFNDLSSFANIFEYHMFQYAVGFLFLSECIIWLLTSIGSHSNKSENSDRGTVWLIVIGWCGSFMVGPYFKSQDAPKVISGWLLPDLFFYVGIALVITGVLIRCASVWTLKKAFTLSVQTTSDQHLIQSGLYGIVRNPAYTGSILSLLGVAFCCRHILGPICVFVICLICYGVRIHVEEMALAAQFKNEFQSYCVKIKYRLFPGIY